MMPSTHKLLAGMCAGACLLFAPSVLAQELIRQPKSTFLVIDLQSIRDEVKLYNLKDRAYERGVPLEVVVGTAPGWADPWSRLQRAYVEREGWRSWLVDEGGYVIDEDEIQLARLTRQERGAL